MAGEILQGLARGSSTRELAANLNLSPLTVRTHIKNILRKLGTHNRAHAVAIAYDRGPIGPKRDPMDDP
jgi:DNA-binding CsgD family transcriptional regulator